MIGFLFIIFFLILLTNSLNFIEGVSVGSFNVSVTVSGFALTIISPANITYPTQTIYFEVFGSNNISFCKYTLDSWQINTTMFRINSTNFNHTNFGVAEGSNIVRFWCNNTLGEINDGQSVFFSIPVSSPSPSSGGGGSSRKFPPNITNETIPLDSSSFLVFKPSFGECEPRVCDVENHRYCESIGFWTEENYCDSEKCGNQDSVCETTVEISCGNRQCERYLDETVFSCFSDCRQRIYLPVTTSIPILVLGFISYFLFTAHKKKKRKRAFEELKSDKELNEGPIIGS